MSDAEIRRAYAGSVLTQIGDPVSIVMGNLFEAIRTEFPGVQQPQVDRIAMEFFGRERKR